MPGIKYLFAIVLLFVSVWNVETFVEYPSVNFNLSQPKKNAVITDANENLIFQKAKSKNRLSKINFTGATVNDGKMPEQKATSVTKRIKSEKNKFKTDQATSPHPMKQIIAEDSSTKEFAREIRSSPNELNINATKIRKPVKLNMKQGLIMNQILNTYGLSNVNNSLCRDHVNEFKLSLRAMEPWALKMFDASSKLMSGILAGNLAELGAWQQCLDINEETAFGPIKGRHCMLFIHPDEKLVKIIMDFKQKISEKHFENLKENILYDAKLMWSVCVPHSCTNEDVLRHFNKSIFDATEGLNLTLSLSKEHCVSVDDLPEFTKGDYIYVFSAGLIIFVALISTSIDVMSEDEPPTFASLFSLKRNWIILFSTKRNINDISCLHGIRFLTMFSVVYGHRFVHNLATPVINYMDLIDWLESFSSTTIHGGTMTVDTFLAVASILVSYSFFGMASKGVKLNIPLFYLNRHLRLLVPLGFAIGAYITVAKHLGGGPLYHDLVHAYNMTCKTFWWSTVFYIQAFVNPRLMCVVQTWFLGVDMFWYYFAPFLLLAISKNPLSGYLLLFTIYSCCTAFNFYIAWVHQFNGQMPVSPILLSTDYFAYHYVHPVVRGGPYMLGLAFGHILFKSRENKVAISRLTNCVCWILVAVCMLYTMLISRSFRLENFEYNRLFASLFLAFHRTVWTLCLLWIIWSCQNGHGGPVNIFLSCTLFKIMGRLCYNVYLFHFLFQSAMQYSKKGPSYFSHFLSTFESIGDMAVMLMFSIPATLCFEYPFSRMCGLVFRPPNQDQTKKVAPLKMDT